MPEIKIHFLISTKNHLLQKYIDKENNQSINLSNKKRLQFLEVKQL